MKKEVKNKILLGFKKLKDGQGGPGMFSGLADKMKNNPISAMVDNYKTNKNPFDSSITYDSSTYKAPEAPTAPPVAPVVPQEPIPSTPTPKPLPSSPKALATLPSTLQKKYTIRQDHSDITDNDLAISYKHNGHSKGIPMFDAFVGLQYANTWNNFGFNIHAGWEEHIIFDTSDFSLSSSGTTTLQGLTLGASVAF